MKSRILRHDRTDYLTIVVVLSMMLVACEGRANDRITYVPEGSSSAVTIIGTVNDYTGQRLTVRMENGTQKSIPADAIESIETYYDPSHLRGIEQFQSGQTEKAVASFEFALTREPRDWVDREIFAWLLKCAIRRQDLSGAITAFLSIVKEDPQTRHWGLAPLIWVPQSVGQSLSAEARQWLVSGQKAERLIGASLLLNDPVYGEPAERELDRLSRDSDGTIADYAKAQLWRLKLGSRQVNELTLESWKSQIERMPKLLRAGPQYLLSRGYEVTGESRRAAAEALWIPFVYVENERIAARALSDGAELLGQSGLTTESERLYRELESRYPWSTEARSAANRQ